MELPKSLSQWTIIRNTENGIKAYWFGSYEDFVWEECCGEDEHLWVTIPFEEWTSDDLAEVFENNIADANYHNWTWLPFRLLASLKYNGASEFECFNILLDTYRNFEQTLMI